MSKYFRVFSSLVLMLGLIAVVSLDTRFARRASMQKKSAAPTQSLVPDLGIGASLNGARPFPSNNAWNMDVSRFSVHSNSANLIASIGSGTGLHADFGTFWEGAPIGIPYMVVPGNQPLVPMNFIWWADQSDPGPYPIPPNAPVEGGTSSEGDRHVLVVDRDNWKLYELYSAYPQNGGASWNAGNGALWDFNSNKLRPETWTSADAAGLPIFPGLVRRDEVVQMQEIRHALRFTVSTSRRSYVYPATHQAGSTTNTNAPPMGLRVRLKSTFNINQTAFSANVRVILRAMQKYGMIVADNGSNWYVSGTHDPLWNDSELSALSRVKGSDFEVVQTPNHLLMQTGDYDGDLRADVAIWRPSNGVWWSLGSDGVVRAQQFGIATDKPAPGDYDGDGKADNAIYRDGLWWISHTSTNSHYVEQFGLAGDIPVAADYDGDGKTDIATFRPSNQTWYIHNSSNNSYRFNQFGLAGDRLVPADYDGDGKADIAVYRPSTGTWWIWNSSNGTFRANQLGVSTDIPVVGDYDADGLADVAVWRPEGGIWFILQSSNVQIRVAQWGVSTDKPTPGDFDGDNRADLAIFRPSEGTWWILQSWDNTTRVNQFGLNGDIPVQAASQQ